MFSKWNSVTWLLIIQISQYYLMNIGLIKRKIYYLIKRKICRNTMADAVENTKMEKLISLFKKLLNRGKCKIAE